MKSLEGAATMGFLKIGKQVLQILQLFSRRVLNSKELLHAMHVPFGIEKGTKLFFLL
jgi:hypothetical protein